MLDIELSIDVVRTVNKCITKTTEDNGTLEVLLISGATSKINSTVINFSCFKHLKLEWQNS